jgi:hypothetical protein
MRVRPVSPEGEVSIMAVDAIWTLKNRSSVQAFWTKKASHRHNTLNIQKENPTILSLTGQL